jgi:RNase adapter protein RapZ
VKVKVMSFGYKYGVPEADVIVDCRKITNPYKDPVLRKLTGLDKPVIDEVKGLTGFEDLMQRANRLATDWCPDTNLVVAFGCFAGRHRSVVAANEFASRIGANGVEHREKERWLVGKTP